MNQKYLITAAKIYSAVFSPFYAPFWAFMWLFIFSYLRMWPLGYKVFVISIVLLFTVIIPRVTIDLFRRVNKWTHWQLSHREHRHMPYLVTLLSYSACLVIMTKMNTAMFFRGVVMSALICQIICAIINAWWKVSTHMVGMGGLVGALNAFSVLFYYNPVWPFCALLILSGALGTSRIILRQHSLAQVLVGFGIGYLCTMTFILMSWM
jgi:membrane-associated phospholipid phosphatase